MKVHNLRLNLTVKSLAFYECWLFVCVYMYSCVGLFILLL